MCRLNKVVCQSEAEDSETHRASSIMYVWYCEELLATSRTLLMSSNPPSNTQNCRCCKQRRQSSGPSAVSQSPPRDEPPVTAPNSGAATEGLMGNKTDEGIRLIPGICGENGNLWLPVRHVRNSSYLR